MAEYDDTQASEQEWPGTAHDDSDATLPAEAQYTAGQADDWPGQEWPGTEVKAAAPAEEWPGQEWPGSEIKEPKAEAEGMLGTAGREAAHSVAPAATGVLAGAGLGAVAGSFLGPAGTIGGGLIGMVAGSMGGNYVQDKVLKAAGIDDDEQRAVNKVANPASSFIGGMLPFAGSPVVVGEKVAAGLAGQFTGQALATRAIGGGMNAAFEAGNQAYQGEFHPGEIAGAALFGAAMPQGNAATRALHGVGESAGNKATSYIPGRPDTQAAPGGADAKADADSSQTPNTGATAQQPAAAPKAPIGQENSVAGGPENYKKKSTPDEVFGNSGLKGFSEGDAHTDPTLQSALPKATLAPETFPIQTGITEAAGVPPEAPAQPAPAAAQPGPAVQPAVDPRVQAAMDRNAEILKQYSGQRQPTAITQEFENNRKIIFAKRGPQIAPEPAQQAMPKAALAPEPIAEAPPPEQRAHREPDVKPAPEPARTSDIEEISPEEAARMAQRREERAKATLAPEPVAAPADTAPILTKPVGNKRLAKEDAAMSAKLRERGFNELADKFEATPEAQRAALRERIAAALPRDRTSEKAGLKNKLGAEAHDATTRDKQNSAIDAIQKAHDEHAPPETETAQELVTRLRAAVATAHEAHGSNPLHRGTGYRPRTLPETFQWFNKVQEAAVRRPEYWTKDKIDAFKAEENAVREASKEYPTQDPRLLDASIEKSQRGGNVAERVLETRAESGDAVETAAVEKTNLERATRAIQELGRYFDGATERNELSAKAQSILDAMPQNIRKAWRDAGEQGADPALKTRVADWLRAHHEAPEPKRFTQDTYEDETGHVTPRVKEIKSRADLPKATLTDANPETDLIKPVAEKPAAKTKKPKYDFEPTTKSGKELDPAEAARILKLAEETQQRNQSRTAPKPSFDKDGDKYSPLKVGTKDLLGKLVDFGNDQSGKLDTKKIGDGFKAWFNKLAAESKEIGPKLPSYIAKRISSDAQRAGRNISEMLNVAGKVDNVIKIHALAGKAQAHELANTKEQQRQMYDALEKQDPNLITDPKLRDVFEHSILPAHLETITLRKLIQEQHPEVDVGRDTSDMVHRRATNGGRSEMELESIGENADPTAGSSPISTTKANPVMERQFAALEDSDGNRHIVHLKIGPNGKPTGEFSVWKDYKNHEMDKAPPLEFKKLNDLYQIGDRKFKMKDALTDEIEANALGTDGKPMKYQRDAAASVYTANAYFRQLQNHLNTLDKIKASPEFEKYATLSNNEAIAKGWKKSETPGFDRYYMDDHLRESLEDAYQQGFNDSSLNKVRNFSRAVTQSIFWTPVAHIMNVEVHWAVGRGFKWLPTTDNYRGLAETGRDAIKSVISHDRIQDILHEHGAGLIYGGTRSENSTAKLALGVGEAIQRAPHKWGPIASKLDMTVGELVRGVYKASRHAMWSVNDMFLTQAILERLRDHGKNIDTASPVEIREAIAHIERHIPNYRTPSRIMSADEGGRAIAKAMRDPLVFGFGRYRYGMFNSYANMIKGVLHGSKEERIETAGQMMVMAAIATVVYPLVYKPIAQFITGNDEAEVRGRGPVAPIMHVKHDLFGHGDIGPLLRETISVSPLVSSAMQLYNFKDFGGRDIIDKRNLKDAQQGSIKGAVGSAAQAAGWAAAQRYSPVSTLNSSLSNPNQGALGGLRDAVLDLKNPSPAAQKYDAQTPKRLNDDHNRRIKKQPNIGDKLLGAIGLD